MDTFVSQRKITGYSDMQLVYITRRDYHDHDVAQHNFKVKFTSNTNFKSNVLAKLLMFSCPITMGININSNICIRKSALCLIMNLCLFQTS
jgi:hypothetical protein